MGVPAWARAVKAAQVAAWSGREKSCGVSQSANSVWRAGLVRQLARIFAFGLEHHPDGQRSAWWPGPDSGGFNSCAFLAWCVTGWAAEGGGDQRSGGSLGVAQALPQGCQALLGLGQGGRDVPRAQMRIVAGVLGGFLDTGTGDGHDAPGGGFQDAAGVDDVVGANVLGAELLAGRGSGLHVGV